MALQFTLVPFPASQLSDNNKRNDLHCQDRREQKELIQNELLLFYKFDDSLAELLYQISEHTWYRKVISSMKDSINTFPMCTYFKI